MLESPREGHAEVVPVVADPPALGTRAGAEDAQQTPVPPAAEERIAPPPADVLRVGQITVASTPGELLNLGEAAALQTGGGDEIEDLNSDVLLHGVFSPGRALCPPSRTVVSRWGCLCTPASPADHFAPVRCPFLVIRGEACCVLPGGSGELHLHHSHALSLEAERLDGDPGGELFFVRRRQHVDVLRSLHRRRAEELDRSA